MDIRPILSSLGRHKLASLLIVLEIAVACAILCNAVFLIRERLTRMQVTTGIVENELVWVKTDGIDGPQATSLLERNLAALRGLAGVKSAALVFPLPLANTSMNFNPTLDADHKKSGPNIGMYVGSQGYLKTLGVKLVEGRDFTDGDFDETDSWLPRSPVMIITRSLAQRLWPGKEAVGQVFWVGEKRYGVIGVVEHLVRGDLRGTASEYAAMFAARPNRLFSSLYALRVDPASRDRLVREASALLLKLNPQMLINDKGTYAELRASYFRQDTAMAWLLAVVCVALLIVTALGIVGLSSFWVSQRRRQIGVRRALGATRRDILRYFQTENFLIVTGGIALGMLFAYGINLFLMTHYELPRLPAAYLPSGAIALWLIGQIAVLGPALRAAAVPPVVATRSV
ncbi:ABC transporter permease [Rhodanobacter sp. Col0626]|uniref:ABC transporter permease n=1 Tax=Rhodanobacter sp. Col0626 TaxID=3415679 RepID=UPI003CF52E99